MPHFTAHEHAAAIKTAPELTDYDLTVQVSTRRKHIGLSVVVVGETAIKVGVPADMAPGELAKALAANRYKLDNLKRDSLARRAEAATAKQLVDGELFPLLGRSIPLRLVDSGSPSFAGLVDGGQVLSLSRRAAERGSIRPLVDFYSRVGTAWLRDEAPALWSRLAPHRTMPQIVAEKIGQTRFGVYDGRKHKIRINWQTLQLPEEHVRHVLLHELVHATRPYGTSHGPQFWATFRRLNPSAKEDEQAMRNSPAARTIWRGDLS